MAGQVYITLTIPISREQFLKTVKINDGKNPFPRKSAVGIRKCFIQSLTILLDSGLTGLIIFITKGYKNYGT